MGETNGRMLAEAVEDVEAQRPRPAGLDIELPHGLLPRVMDGRWKKLMVFLGGKLMWDYTNQYRIEGCKLHLSEAPFHSLVVIDPMDGERWVYAHGQWAKV